MLWSLVHSLVSVQLISLAAKICGCFSLPMCKRANCWEIVFLMFIWVELEGVHNPVDCPACFITRLLSTAAGTQGSRQSCTTSQMTHCPDTRSATGPVFLAKCQMSLVQKAPTECVGTSLNCTNLPLAADLIRSSYKSRDCHRFPSYFSSLSRPS